jgi:hypothetical protein
MIAAGGGLDLTVAYSERDNETSVVFTADEPS